MGKKILLLLVLFSVALVGTTYAAVENIKVSGDINSEAVVRDINLGVAGVVGVDNDDQFAFTQIRLRFDADLTEGVSAVVGLINERVWGQESVANTDLDLDLAYVELKEFLYEQVSLTIGRQNLRYGNGLIIGDPDTNKTSALNSTTIGGCSSLRKSFDAVKAAFDYAPFVIDLVYAKIAENTLDMNDDVTLFGVNVSYVWDSYNGITEAYLFGSDKAPGNSNAAIDSKSNVYVIGARNQLDLNDNLGLGLELAYQFGEYRANATRHPDLDAYAIQANAEYKVLNDYDAKFGLQYTYLSGDDSTSDDYNAWNPLFEDQTPGEILNILFGNTNMQYLKASVSAVPREDVTVGVNYTYARLAEKIATLPLSVGPATGNTYAINADKRDIGQEIDLVGVFDYTEDVQIKLAGGLFLPGHLFDKANDNSGYSVRAGINVDF